MQITREFLEKRKADLVKQQSQLLANIGAFNGAIEDVDALLAHLDAPEPAPTEEK